ncbi:MAG TPA: SRPBCC family protein [Micromonosporaceae bacterium]
MGLVKSDFIVAAPIDRVFAFIAHPPNFSRMWPAMVRVFDITPSPQGGDNWRWTYRMLGMRLEGDTEVLEYDPPRLIAMQSAGGGMGVSHVWSLEPVGLRTRLTLAMEFLLPIQWLSGVAGPLLERENRQQVAIAMGNLRRALEGR